MKRWIAIWATASLLIVIGSALLYLWLASDAAWDLGLRLPGADDRVAEAPTTGAPTEITGTLQTFNGQPSNLPGQWPRFRGPEYDNICRQEVPLARSWPEGGPPVLWSVALGEGYAGPAIKNGRVYVIDYDRPNGADVIRCFSLDDGAEIWRYSYPVVIKRFHGMSRAIPTVTDEVVVAIGPKCHVTCLDADSGQFRWMIDMVGKYGATVPLWYGAQCPVVEDGKAILAPGGDEVLMMAVDVQTGEVVWTCPNPDGWVMTHSSILPMTFAGRRFYVYCAGDDRRGGVIAVDARDGSVVWKITDWKVRTNVPMPVRVGEDRLFFCAGYGQYDSGCMMLRLSEEGGAIQPEVLYMRDIEAFGSMQQTPIWYEEHLYGVRITDKQLLCMNDQAEVVWGSSTAVTFGHGPYAIADGLIFAMDDEGLLRLAQATATGYVQLAEARVLNGHESWAPLAFASGRLLVRDTEHMVCLDIAAR